jgi:hypothetical protein
MEEDSATIWGLLDINSTQINTIEGQVKTHSKKIQDIEDWIGDQSEGEDSGTIWGRIAINRDNIEAIDNKLGKPSNENEKRTVWEIIEALENELNMLKQ